MTTYKKPLPLISDVNRAFWDAAKRHQLRLQRCAKCSRYWYPPGPVCPFCWSRDFDWSEVSGRGKVTSWVVFHQLYYEGFKDDIPYNVAQVELAEGPRLIANLVDVRNEDIRMDMPVEVIFEDVTADVTLPQFRPVKPT